MEKNEIAGSLARTVDLAAANAHAVINKTADVAHPAVEQISASMHQAMNKVSSAATHAADMIDTRSKALLEMQTRIAESCRNTLRDKPLTTLAIAVGTGFLLSWLLRQRLFSRCSRE